MAYAVITRSELSGFSHVELAVFDLYAFIANSTGACSTLLHSCEVSLRNPCTKSIAVGALLPHQVRVAALTIAVAA